MNYRNNDADEVSLDGGVKDITENCEENGKEKILTFKFGDSILSAVNLQPGYC